MFCANFEPLPDSTWINGSYSKAFVSGWLKNQQSHQQFFEVVPRHSNAGSYMMSDDATR